MKIENVNRADLAQLTAWITDEFPYFKTDPEHYANRLDQRPLEAYKISEDGVMRGYIEIEKISATEVRINGIGIDPQHRNRGLAQQLVEFVLDRIEKQPFKRIFLLVHPSNTTAQHIYAKNGFQYKGPYTRTINGEVVEEWEKKN